MIGDQLVPRKETRGVGREKGLPEARKKIRGTDDERTSVISFIIHESMESIDKSDIVGGDAIPLLHFETEPPSFTISLMRRPSLFLARVDPVQVSCTSAVALLQRSFAVNCRAGANAPQSTVHSFNGDVSGIIHGAVAMSIFQSYLHTDRP